MGLIEFLRARLDEDEATATAATCGNWRYNPRKQWHSPPQALGVVPGGEEFVAAGPFRSPVCIAATGPADHPQSMADAKHIAEWDPTRVLLEAEAKRRIIDRCIPVVEMGGWEFTDAPDLAEAVLRDLAQPYADHPDFDPAWLARSPDTV